MLLLWWLGACGDSRGDPSGADGTDTSGSAFDDPPTVRVLFVGNSYTAANDLADVVARLAEAPQSPMHFEVAAYTRSTQTWEGHDADPMVTDLIEEGWDYVVLQDQSAQPWEGPPQDVKPALYSLDAKVKAADAQTVLFMTWARETHGFSEEMLIESYYESAGEATDARIAPVGRAWDRAVRNPSMSLYRSDGSHPNPLGSYLAACVFYGALTGESPVGLGDGGLDVSAREATTLQRIAWEAVQAVERPTPPLLGAWPLSSLEKGDNFLPAGDLVLGDATGPDGSTSSATSFGPTAYGGVPYFAGMNTPALTVAFDVFRADWSVPAVVPQHLVSKHGAYDLSLVGSTLTASVFTSPDDAMASAPVPSSEIVFASETLVPGWHCVALTHDGIVDELWIDGQRVGSAPTSAVACPTRQAGCAAGIALGVQSEMTLASGKPDALFTGALADLRLYDTALTGADIGVLCP